MKNLEQSKMNILLFYSVTPMILALLMASTLVLGACQPLSPEQIGQAGDVATMDAPPDDLTPAVTGVTDTEIILGAHTPLTGPLANFSQINRAALAYFNYINATEGGVHGRKIIYVLADDQYTPPLSAEVTQKLVEEDDIFAMVGGLGTPHLAAIDYLAEQDVPDLFVIGGNSEWTKDPAARPMVFGAVTHFAGEGAVLGDYLIEIYAGKKLGLVYQETGYEAGVAALKNVVGDALAVVAEESYAVGPPDLSSQVAALHDAGAEVIVAFAGGPYFADLVQQVRTGLSWDVPILAPGPGMSGGVMAGSVAEGVISVDWQRSWAETDDPGIAQHLAILAEYSDLEQATPETLFGQYLGELTVEVLRRAGPELTRSGVVAAAESIQDWLCSICLYPINLSATDHSAVDTVVLSRFDGQTWVPFGDGYSWEGVRPDALNRDSLQRVPYPYVKE